MLIARTAFTVATLVGYILGAVSILAPGTQANTVSCTHQETRTAGSSGCNHGDKTTVYHLAADGQFKKSTLPFARAQVESPSNGKTQNNCDHIIDISLFVALFNDNTNGLCVQYNAATPKQKKMKEAISKVIHLINSSKNLVLVSNGLEVKKEILVHGATAGMIQGAPTALNEKISGALHDYIGAGKYVLANKSQLKSLAEEIDRELRGAGFQFN
ncbi:hypothetical protein HK405_001181, partial [Cladochytrium tenue]